jgi:carbon-monoxide dehydrogenase medium subunit
MATEALIPASPEEAAQLFGEGHGITVIAGGTILLPDITAGRIAPARALLLHRSGLDELRAADGVVRIGAMVPVAALAGGDEDVLAQFARHVADGEVRRSATLGGNLCAPPGREAQRGDLGAPLIALGARVHSTGSGGERTEAVEDFLAGDRAARLVLEVEYDRVPRRSAAELMRRRHTHSYAVANVAVCETEGKELRVGVSGVGPVAVRCRTVESSRNPDDVLQDVDPVDDAVASADYRRKMLPVLLRRALDRLESA